MEFDDMLESNLDDKTTELTEEASTKEKKHVVRRKIEEVLEMRRMRDEGGWFDDEFEHEYGGV